MSRVAGAAGSLLVAGLLAVAGTAGAQTISVVTTPPSSAPEMGRVVVVGGATSFSIDATTGAVTRLGGGTAIRLSTLPTTSPTVSISCTGSPLCDTLPVQVSITAIGGSGAATFSQFSVANLTNTTFVGGAPTPASSLNFSLNPVGNRTASFSLGSQVSVSGSATAGDHSFSYVVSASIL